MGLEGSPGGPEQKEIGYETGEGSLDVSCLTAEIVEARKGFGGDVRLFLEILAAREPLQISEIIDPLEVGDGALPHPLRCRVACGVACLLRFKQEQGLVIENVPGALRLEDCPLLAR